LEIDVICEIFSFQTVTCSVAGAAEEVEEVEEEVEEVEELAVEEKKVVVPAVAPSPVGSRRRRRWARWPCR
jgi:hypothetical protein